MSELSFFIFASSVFLIFLNCWYRSGPIGEKKKKKKQQAQIQLMSNLPRATINNENPSHKN